MKFRRHDPRPGDKGWSIDIGRVMSFSYYPENSWNVRLHSFTMVKKPESKDFFTHWLSMVFFSKYLLHVYL